MSFENTVCPCGGKKECGTMLCAERVAAFEQHPSMAVYLDKSNDMESRRHAALTLLELARGRKRIIPRSSSDATKIWQKPEETAQGRDSAAASGSWDGQLVDKRHG